MRTDVAKSCHGIETRFTLCTRLTKFSFSEFFHVVVWATVSCEALCGAEMKLVAIPMAGTDWELDWRISIKRMTFSWLLWRKFMRKKFRGCDIIIWKRCTIFFNVHTRSTCIHPQLTWCLRGSSLAGGSSRGNFFFRWIAGRRRWSFAFFWRLKICGVHTDAENK